MAAITFTYGSTPVSKTFEALSVKGFGPDDVLLVNFVMNTSDDGALYPYVEAFRRRFIVDLGVVADFDDRVFLVEFWRNVRTQKLSYGAETNVAVVMEEPETLTSDWIHGAEELPALRFAFIEKLPRTGLPSAWEA